VPARTGGREEIAIIENKCWVEPEVADSAKINKVGTQNDLLEFAHASGSLNPMHLPHHRCRRRRRSRRWSAASRPGPGTL
jgi:hypothetical protein